MGRNRPTSANDRDLPARLLGEWLRRSPSPVRIKITIVALGQWGVRKDLAIVSRYLETSQTEELRQVFSDLEYVVSRTSLD